MTKKHPVKGFFFDLDGTLLDTSEDFVAVLHQMQQHDNLKPLDADIIKKHVSEGSEKLVQLAYMLPDTHPEIPIQRERFLAAYSQHIQLNDRDSAAQIYDGISTLINALEERNIAWGVITNKPFPYAALLLKQAQLADRCQVLICPEHVNKSKPDPEALILACQKTNTKPEKSIYIGDHLRDIEAGKKAGMHTLSALYGYIPETETPELWPSDHNVNLASEILPWLEHINWQIPWRT